MKLLIKAGADVNLKETNLGLCPLRMAVDSGEHDIAALLIAAGAVNPPPEPNRPAEEEEEAAEEAAPAPAPEPETLTLTKSQDPWDPSVAVSACCIVS